MKIFIDSADLEEIKEALSWGITDGITTNPSLIKKSAEQAKTEAGLHNYIIRLLKAANNKPFSLEVEGQIDGRIDEEQMIKEAKNLYRRFKQYNSKLNIKIPVNPALIPTDSNNFSGLRTIRTLQNENIPVNATLIMTPEQALLAAKAGAQYISPFMGRIDDYVKNDNDNGAIQSGIELIKETMAVLRPYDFRTEVIAASIRTVEHVRESAKAGAHIATIPFKILTKMVSHPKTYEGVNIFLQDTIPEYRAILRT